MKNIFLAVACLVISMPLAFAQQNPPSPEEQEKKLSEFIQKEVDRLEMTLKLEDWQVFYVDSTLNHDYTALNAEFKKMSDLSKGQRATALLLLLLGASRAPLVIDQPEDDLDNRFVYDGIVRNLRELKGKRQVIAATHNANVPVLGDAELVIALEGNGRNGMPAEGGVGSLDDATIRELTESILEGGPAAFNARQHLYGF